MYDSGGDGVDDSDNWSSGRQDFVSHNAIMSSSTWRLL